MSIQKGKRSIIVSIAIMVVLIVLSGCTNGGSPKEALLKAMEKTAAAESYSAQTTVTIHEANIPVQGDKAASAGYVATVLKGSKLHMNTEYRKEPFRTDWKLQLELAGGGVTLNVPMIATGDKLYMKLPALPALPLPEAATDKYIELALQEQNNASKDAEGDVAANRQLLAGDVQKLIMTSFDGDGYFSELETKDAGLPEGVKAERVIRFGITPQNQADAAAAVTGKLLPGLYDLLLDNAEYLKLLNVTKERVEQWKGDLAAGSDGLTERLKAGLKVNDISIVSAIRDGYVHYQSMTINVEWKDTVSGAERVSGKLDLRFDTEYNGINKPVAFEQELPTDPLTWEQFTQLLQSPSAM
ncbi:hypothetical protein ACFSL6_24145 [Paenibacillus thailandensis]|uniref:Lipoprotein n=1 Tax=Paenibacillus thailandensis TaxID=393250 RepID=A0ABW5R403_9BACL